jgi:peptidylprolyl isomerase
VTELPPDFKPSVGDQVQLRDPQGQPLNSTVCEVGEDVVKFDANHPLAGKELTFEITLVGLS